jgi:hypothetical protein
VTDTDLLSRLPNELRASAIRVHAQPDIAGIGWTGDLARRVVAALRSSDAVVLGVEVHERRGDEILPRLADQWTMEPPSAREPPSSYVRRSHAGALAFINDYGDPGDGNIIYEMTVAPYNRIIRRAKRGAFG